MKEIPLTGKYGAGKIALVDDRDFDQVNQYKWCQLSATDERPVTWMHGKSVLMYRFITGMRWIDHKDRNVLNNTRANLRLCTNATNSQNRSKQRTYGGKPTSSQYKGVWLSFNKKWIAQITINGKQIHLGQFDTENEAAQAYNEAAVKYFGQYAHLNVILEAA